MATQFSVPGATNTYVASDQASGGLIVGFSRNPNTFPLASYVQYSPSLTPQGLYIQWKSQEAARVLEVDDKNHRWAPGSASPSGNNQLEQFAQQSYLCQRFAYPWMLDNEAVDNATWDVMGAEGDVQAQRCMTARTVWTLSILKNTAWGSNTASVDGAFSPNPILPSGQNWTNGGVGYGSTVDYVGASGPNIKQCLQYGSKVIHQQTIGTVRPKSLCLVVNPTTAQAMARSTEIQDYLKQSPAAPAQIFGNSPTQNGMWGLPETLYGVKIVVEDTVWISSNVNAATTVTQYALPDNDAYLLAREGTVDGFAGRPSFCTVRIFFHRDEMTYETMYDQNDRVYKGRIVSYYVPVVVAPQSGFYFQHVLGS